MSSPNLLNSKPWQIIKYVNVKQKTMSLSEVKATCSRFGKIERLQIYASVDGDYAIVTFMNPLNLPWLSQGQKLEKKGAMSQWILRSEEYELEMIEGDFVEDPIHIERANDIFTEEIPELIDDVLLHLFEFLDINDLTAVARCCKRFKYLAHRIYIASSKLVVIIENGPFQNKTAVVEFGPNTHHLEIEKVGYNGYNDNALETRRLFRHVNPNHLKCLKLSCKSGKVDLGYSTFLEMEIKLFPNLETLFIECWCFPCLRSKHIAFEDLSKLCPKLKSVKFSGGPLSVKSGFKGVRPCLEALHIRNADLEPHHWEWFFWASANLKEIEVYKAWCLEDASELIELIVKYRVQKNVRRITFTGSGAYFLNADLSSFSNLEYMHFGASYSYLFCDIDALNTISKVSTLKTIEIMKAHGVLPPCFNKFLVELAMRMPQLKSMKIEGYPASTSEIDLIKKILPNCIVCITNPKSY